MSYRHSARAKQGTRSGINLRIEVIQSNVNQIQQEINKYHKYLGRGLNDAWIKKVIKQLNVKLKKRKAQLKVYQDRKKDYKKRGLI